MNVKQNPRDTYKALLLDYDALLAASDNECSYCLSEREVQMMLAFVEYIGWRTRYIATETEIDKSLILLWQGNLARKLMSGCCGGDGTLHRFSDQGIYQSSQDGGATWEDDPNNDPRNQGTAAPPLPGAPSDSKRCAAADNVRGLFEQYRDNLISILGTTPTVIAIIAGILALIGTLLGLSGVGIGIGVLFLGLAAELIQLGGTGVSGELTFLVMEEFKCLVYCRMNEDGELTYESWQGLLSDIAGHFSGFKEHFFYQTVAGMGYIGINNAGTMGAATASDCGGCDCGACSFDGSIALFYGSGLAPSDLYPGWWMATPTLESDGSYYIGVDLTGGTPNHAFVRSLDVNGNTPLPAGNQSHWPYPCLYPDTGCQVFGYPTGTDVTGFYIRCSDSVAPIHFEICEQAS